MFTETTIPSAAEMLEAGRNLYKTGTGLGWEVAKWDGYNGPAILDISDTPEGEVLSVYTQVFDPTDGTYNIGRRLGLFSTFIEAVAFMENKSASPEVLRGLEEAIILEYLEQRVSTREAALAREKERLERIRSVLDARFESFLTSGGK